LAQAAAICVRDFGATGDGKTLDTPAINKAIDAAAEKGGGTVFFPAGDYLSVSIHLKSNVALHLMQGATIVAADPKEGHKYEPAEPNPDTDQWQDFGHSHWHNSLIWGENLENVSIIGPGRIWGKGLVRSGNQSRTKEQSDAIKGTQYEGRDKGSFGYPSASDATQDGWGNKAIALKLCRNVTIRDVTIQKGGHFGILATGVDNLVIDNVKMDTSRDGMDIDACRNVRVSNCSVNSPWDDGICLKSTHSLGFARACENITITNCAVSGYDEGTFLDGTYKREVRKYSHNTTTGRIKFGTESNGGFKNITITNCLFAYSRGLALETVDGGLIEDVTISNITMRDIVNAPIYLRLGARLRGPKETTQVGALRRVTISDVVIHNAPTEQGVLIVGIPDHPIEDVVLSNIRIDYAGGGDAKLAAVKMDDHIKDYPEPANHGPTPAYGLFARHVNNLQLTDIKLTCDKPDVRPPIVLENVNGAELQNIKAKKESNVPTVVQGEVNGLVARRVQDTPDTE
jgi:polygalacturonase